MGEGEEGSMNDTYFRIPYINLLPLAAVG